jgi:hypothetical protein
VELVAAAGSKEVDTRLVDGTELVQPSPSRAKSFKVRHKSSPREESLNVDLFLLLDGIGQIDAKDVGQVNDVDEHVGELKLLLPNTPLAIASQPLTLPESARKFAKFLQHQQERVLRALLLIPTMNGRPCIVRLKWLDRW